MMPALKTRAGFSLPMALLVMVVLTAGIVAGFAATSAEVLTYAAWSKAVVNVTGAWFALDGLSKNGNAGTIDGTDQCTAANGGGKPSVAGAVVPSGGQFSGPAGPFSGNPPVDSSKSFAQLAATSKLDWAG